VTASTGIITTIPGSTGGWALALDTVGNLYVAWSSKVLKVEAVTGAVTTVAGNGVYGYSGDGGPATLAQLANPQGVAVDSSGNIYIADTENGRIRKVKASTGVISTIVKNVNCDAGLNPLCAPAGLAADSTGNIYIAQPFNSYVLKLRPSAPSNDRLSIVAGIGDDGFSGDGGSATAAELAYPRGVFVDSNNNVYIADAYNFRVRKVDGATGIITTVAGNGIDAYSGDGDYALDAAVREPWGVAVDNSGNIYIADRFDGRVRVVGKPLPGQ
jgi:sugar lactone lactonase YvrE